MSVLQYCLLALLGGLLAIAIVTDLASRTIANRLNLAVALSAIAWWFASGLSPSDIGFQLLGAAVMLILFGLAFAIGAMGGGDVKLIVALALWLPAGLLVKLLLLMSIGGGVLTMAMLGLRFVRRTEGAIEVPYGVAIAGAALLIMANDILTNAPA